MSKKWALWLAASGLFVATTAIAEETKKEEKKADAPAAAPAAEAKPATAAAPAAADAAKTVTTASGLKYEDLKVGDGAEAKAGQKASVHYTGWLTDGKKFDSSLDRGQPFQFTLGQGMVIKGWDEGVAGMKVGGKRKLMIPAALGYGARGAGSAIPPNSDLVFEVELLDVK